eukprot:384277_1
MYHSIFVKTLMGKTITIKMQPNDTVQSLAIKVQEKEGIFYFLQRLMFAGVQLESERTLSHYDINDMSTIHLSLRLCYRKYWIIRVDSYKYLDEIFEAFDHKVAIKKVKEIICDYHSGEDYEQFDKMYDLYFNNNKLNNSQNIGEATKEAKTLPSVLTDVFRLDVKTKDGKIWYLENKAKVFKKRNNKYCMILVFGYVRTFENQHKWNIRIPIAMKSIINQYLDVMVEKLLLNVHWPDTMYCP